MPLLVGAVLALAVGLFARASGLDRDRAFYPTVTIVVAFYYCLFAAMGAPARALALESLAAGAFLVVALLGFRSSLWPAAGGLGAHGVFDLAHGAVISNPGVPGWWPAFCPGFDVTAAAYLAWLLASGACVPRSSRCCCSAAPRRRGGGRRAPAQEGGLCCRLPGVHEERPCPSSIRSCPS